MDKDGRRRRSHSQGGSIGWTAAPAAEVRAKGWTEHSQESEGADSKARKEVFSQPLLDEDGTPLPVYPRPSQPSIDVVLRSMDTEVATNAHPLPPLPPSMSELLYGAKVAVLECVYKSQWRNLISYHALHVQYGDSSLQSAGDSRSSSCAGRAKKNGDSEQSRQIQNERTRADDGAVRLRMQSA